MREVADKMDRKVIEDMIDNAGLSIISSIDEDGYPVSRAFLGFKIRDGLKEFYFSTNTPTNKVKQFGANPKASVYFFDKSRFIGCLLTGEMELLYDMDSRKKVWSDGDEMYYPGGIEDPDMTVLRFTTTKPVRVYSNFQTIEIMP